MTVLKLVGGKAASTSASTGALQVAGGIGLGAASFSTDNFTFGGTSGRTATFNNGIIGIRNTTAEMIRIFTSANSLVFGLQVENSTIEFRDDTNTSVVSIGGTDGNVGIGTTTPNANAILDVTSTTKAFMPPRMTTVQRTAISPATEGLMVYDTNLHKLCKYVE